MAFAEFDYEKFMARAIEAGYYKADEAEKHARCVERFMEIVHMSSLSLRVTDRTIRRKVNGELMNSSKSTADVIVLLLLWGYEEAKQGRFRKTSQVERAAMLKSISKDGSDRSKCNDALLHDDDTLERRQFQIAWSPKDRAERWAHGIAVAVVSSPSGREERDQRRSTSAVSSRSSGR